MVTGWTLFIVFVVAYGNALVGMIGVRTRMREGMRLWANDRGYYVPRHLGHLGFWRGLLINLAFAGTSFSVGALVLKGDSSYCGRETIVAVGVANFIWSCLAACLIPSDFEQVVVPFD